MNEGHDADHDADETGQQGEDHEGPSGVPVSCGNRMTGGPTGLKRFTDPKFNILPLTLDWALKICF